MSEVIIKAKNLCLEYKIKNGILSSFSHKALDNINLEIYKGEIVGITGRNGCGKSTLLKVLSGIYEPDSGEVWMPPGTTVAVLSLGLGFKPTLTGRDNALLSCMLNGYTKAEAKSLIVKIQEMCELGKFFNQPVKSYSSGMRSRLGFAINILLDVDVLMIDEVLSVGDKQFKEKAEKIILEKLKGNKTVLFVSHNKKQIERICSRTIEL